MLTEQDFNIENAAEFIAPRLAYYNYTLPEEKIAQYPLAQRDDAKLLVHRQGQLIHATFKDIGHFLPQDALLVFNETKVVQARLHFQRETGAKVEVFCLSPLLPFKEISQAMQVRGQCRWYCMLGNAKKWKAEETLKLQLPDKTILEACLICKNGRYGEVEFNWQPQQLTWAEILSQAGKMPLPPYLNRAAEETDTTQYQTVFAAQEGAVAAPTAGLHFTGELLQQLQKQGIEQAKLTLHVGAGTFQPIEDEDILQHPMHNEQLEFSRHFVETISRSNKQIIPVGTTSMRALESLYWFGVQLGRQPQPGNFFVQKLEPYIYHSQKMPSVKEAMQNVLAWMDEKDLQQLWGQTEIFIFPPYKMRVCKGLITNFHLPQSTLLLLVSALIGQNWKKVYESALKENYRFLSYGDGSLLLP